MEQELFFSGYCRTVDGHRMVAVVTEDGSITEVDCCYHSCPHAISCEIARKIDELKK